MNRRTFLTTGSLGLAAGLAALPHRHVEPSIVGAELYLINVEAVRHFSTGTWYNRQHLMLHLRTDAHGGWSEIIASVNEPEVDLSEWGERATLVVGKTPREALDWLRAEKYGNWDSKPVEWLEFALYDLLGRQEDTPAVRLLGLADNQSVPGLFAILESDPARLLAKVEEARAQQLTSHVKLKLFGDAGKRPGADPYPPGSPRAGGLPHRRSEWRLQGRYVATVRRYPHGSPRRRSERLRGPRRAD